MVTALLLARFAEDQNAVVQTACWRGFLHGIARRHLRQITTHKCRAVSISDLGIRSAQALSFSGWVRVFSGDWVQRAQADGAGEVFDCRPPCARQPSRPMYCQGCVRMFANAILLSPFNNLSALELLDLSLDLNISQQDFVNVTSL
jgi:hypothetical protein